MEQQAKHFSQHVKPAGAYQPAHDLWIITSFFNPQQYSTKYDNFLLFSDSLERSGLNYLVIECAFEGQPFTFPASSRFVRVRSKSILWQKERLLNVAISALPPDCTKVAWIDCDVLFEKDSWAVETSKLLDSHVVVQPFDSCVRLPRTSRSYEGVGERYESFASVYQRNCRRLPDGDFRSHGHTGFAWAIRREIVSKHGLYDACISGSADHLMAHAFTGDFYSGCNAQLFFHNDLSLKHFHQWGKAVYLDVAGSVGCLSGTLLHLWHGDTCNRQYLKKNRELASLNFNPYEDIYISNDECWDWSCAGLSKPALQEWAAEFYASRREDG